MSVWELWIGLQVLSSYDKAIDYKLSCVKENTGGEGD